MQKCDFGSKHKPIIGLMIQIIEDLELSNVLNGSDIDEIMSISNNFLDRLRYVE